MVRAQSNYRKTGNGEKEKSSVLPQRPLREQPLFGKGRKGFEGRLEMNEVVRARLLHCSPQ